MLPSDHQPSNAEDPIHDAPVQSPRLFRGKGDIKRMLSHVRRAGWWRGAALLTGKLTHRANWAGFYAYHRAFDLRFERRYGVQTTGVRLLSGLSIRGENEGAGLEYEPTPVRALRSMFHALPIHRPDYTYVDFGSGKGRSLLVAAESGFGQVRGVEFARELHESAVANIESFRERHRPQVDLEALHLDALEFEPPDRPCVFYFYYPFRGELWGRVLDNLMASYRRSPRPMYFVNRMDKREWTDECEQLYGRLEGLQPYSWRPSAARLGVPTPYQVRVYRTREE